MTRKDRFEAFIQSLQNEICEAFEQLDGAASFNEEQWTREAGGGGTTRIIKNGDLFEKGGVNTSSVHGDLPDQIKKKFGVTHEKFYAAGVSLVMHPWSPMVPTIHANFRYFELYRHEVGGDRMDAWFGGGIDLTPYYLWEEDARHFHSTLKDACDPHGSDLYPRFKEKCDNYFYLDHRQEARGIGGVFFDYLRENDNRTLDDWHRFTTSVGNCFLSSYTPIAKRRRNVTYGEQERYFQEVQRGRYVEFNLVYDRGTLFGLKTGGRTESILMSMPPRVRWEYDFVPEEGSREKELKDVLKNPRDWID